MRRFLGALLSVTLVLASVPASAIERSVPVVGKLGPTVGVSVPSLSLPALSGTALPATTLPALTTPAVPQAQAVVPAPQAAAPTGPAALDQLQAAEPTEQRSAEAAGAQTFDGALKPKTAVSGALAAAGLALPIALSGAHIQDASYDAANALSVAFPFPQIYRTYAQGHAKNFPLKRAALGAFGTIALGLVNAPMLDKPFWGAAHIFIGLGMLAPFFLGKFLERKNAGERRWMADPADKEKSAGERLWKRLRGDAALGRSLLLGLPLAAASVGLYIASAAFTPHLLAASLTQPAIENVLLGLQLFKMALFVGMFAPDVAALFKGKAPHGFTLGFNAVFLASTAAFTAWGFTAAAHVAPGPVRDQYLVMGLRNLCEAIASGLSLAAILRARAKK